MDRFDSIYPLEVYRYVSDEGQHLADGWIIDGEIVGGTVLPPFTRAVAEAIAATRPSWARFADTDIAPDVHTHDHTHVYVSWVRAFGEHVAVEQEVAYEWDGRIVGPTGFPRIVLRGRARFLLELEEGDEARALAASFTQAAELLDGITTTTGW